ncbi:GNAT family N-acetyltransferase [Actinospica durhamensis]|uniref:GNAT family N-acetyltransferase n=1 Tax=Actinospica durhamensis TaxID=1508375 RepID=A0A941IQD8_9ACTN|nr:GNAT family N-acetyltransferase [Actinospica durhamensis]MBR7834102.1 GNAT family N-acetyltransferase [Actinospica durhamensis]
MESLINAFLYGNAANRRVHEACGPFMIGFDADNDLKFLNYAVPEPDADPTPQDISALIAAFEARGRMPRLEFARKGAALVEPALLAAGFTVEQRLPFMLIVPADLAWPLEVPGVAFHVLDDSATDEELHGVALTQYEAFQGDPAGVDFGREVEGLRGGIARGGAAVLACAAPGTPDAGAPMGAGNFGAPRAGTTEIGGIAVREAFRRRGIGAAVTGVLSRAAFDLGLECAWLSPAGPAQERMYASIGYRSSGEMVFIAKE